MLHKQIFHKLVNYERANIFDKLFSKGFEQKNFVMFDQKGTKKAIKKVSSPDSLFSSSLKFYRN